MIKVNFRDGTTLAFDLQKQEDYQQWLEWSTIDDFQKRITGIGILHNKKYITLPFPRKFRKIKFYAELVHNKKGNVVRILGERLICHADEIKLSLLIYTHDDPPPPVFSKVQMEKVGKQMFPGSLINECK